MYSLWQMTMVARHYKYWGFKGGLLCESYWRHCRYV